MASQHTVGSVPNSAFGVYRQHMSTNNNDIVWLPRQQDPVNSEPLKVSLIHSSDSVHAFPPSVRQTLQNQQMTIMATAIPSTSASNVPIRQPQKPVIRIAQPQNNQHQQNHYASFKPQLYHHYQSSASSNTDSNNFTTTFHANFADGMTTVLPLQNKNNLGQKNYYSGINQKQKNFAQHNDEKALTPPTILSGSTAFPSTSNTGILHYNSAPSLPIHRLLSQQQRPSTSSLKPELVQPNSLISNQRAFSSQLSFDPSNMSQKNMFDFACAQQRQIDANISELEERRRLISSTIATAAAAKRTINSNCSIVDQVRNVKNQIERDEKELLNLGNIQREARKINEHNQLQRRELAFLESTYEQNDLQLRMAVEKVDSLRKQLELLHQRRASAASAAIAQQRKINGDLVANNGELQLMNTVMMKPLQINQPQFTLTKLSTQQNRPQASVTPFQLASSNIVTSNIINDDYEKSISNRGYDEFDATYLGNVNNICDKSPNLSVKKNRAPPPPFSQTYKDIPIRNFDDSQRFLARGKPDQLSLRSDSLSAIKRRSWVQAQDENSTDNIWRYLVEEQRKGRTHVSFIDIMEARNSYTKDYVHLNTNTIQKAKPFDNLPQVPSQQQKQNLTQAKLEEKSIQQNHQIDELDDLTISLVSTDVSISKSSPKKEIIQENKEEQCFKVEQFTTLALSNSLANQNKNNENSIINQDINEKPELKDKLNLLSLAEEECLRNESSESDTSNTTTNEVDDIESHNSSSSNCDDNESKSNDIVCDENEEKKLNHDSSSDATLCDDNLNLTNNVTNTHYLENNYDEDDEGFDSLEPPEYLISGMEEASSTTTDEACSSISGGDEPVFDEQSLRSSKETKSILRTSIVTHHKRRVVFDQTVLFLDVAYEGEYEMLVELAKQIPDISVANGEGITALHNAICAGNHDIVKFLIDNHADVNALDLDGWSPLHCAASCNNFAMLKQLIEMGACVFSTTLSKAETAADLFDDTDNLSGANYIDFIENCMGLVNDKKVYAAFSYDAEYEDELSFEEGDELKVIDKNILLDVNNKNFDESEFEPLWWLCKHTKGERVDQQGLVPRNYLSLYPTWKYREIHNFDSIELPTEIPSTAFQRRRRLLQQAQHEDDDFSLLQWSNVAAVAAAASAQETLQNNATITQSTTTTTNTLTSNSSQQLSTFA